MKVGRNRNGGGSRTSGRGPASSEAVQHACRHFDEQFEAFKGTLVELARIPSVSAEGFPAEEVRRSAEATASVLRRTGLEHVEVLEVPGVHPYVYADWLHRPGAPTVLVYGHHDVVPPGRADRWLSPPFEPVERAGRLYGRGTADDKGGILAHVAALACCLATSGDLPVNVRLVVEGEEEIGSGNLGRFLKRYGAMLPADVVVLSDTSNFDTGVPALTYRLRGLCQVDVEVRCLERPVHSGQKGGAVPDAVQVLCRLIAGLQAEDGTLDVPGLYRRVEPVRGRALARLRALPFDPARFKRQAGLLRGVELAGERSRSVWERLWTRPSLTVIAFEARSVQGSSNQIIESARARLSMRTVPRMDGHEAARLLIRKLTSRPPYGARVTARLVRTSPWWETDPEGPAFDAARRALRAGFSREPIMMGAGGSIGFVQPFADHLPGAPFLLMGVEDPACNAHSENESLHLGDWRKCVRSAIHLYHELSGP